MTFAGSSIKLGKLEEVDPRQVWKSESGNLTPWLQEHLDLLADEIGIEIVSSQREVRVGSYVLDIRAEDSTGRPLILENQLETTNHSHLGQLLVYGPGSCDCDLADSELSG